MRECERLPTKMFQCESYWIARDFWISERKVLADTEETLEVNVGLHADDDGRPCCLHVLLSVSADENEGVGHRAGCRNCGSGSSEHHYFRRSFISIFRGFYKEKFRRNVCSDESL